ncbi:MAG: hypothetical protein Q4B95_04225 [Lonepinella koalarum]|nr:hypothetical protein [Lonepinella koalarum]
MKNNARKNNLFLTLLLLLLCGNVVYANVILEKKLKDSAKQASPKYMMSSNQELNPNVYQNDADELGHSVEFEVFKINEDSVSHTTFKSNAGICYGFKQGNGVQVTDASTYYMTQNSHEEYYLNIADAEVVQGKNPKAMKYIPVFNIHDQEILKQVQEEDKKLGNKLAEVNIEERSKILSNVVCKKRSN